jgi:hypothetical protein
MNKKLVIIFCLLLITNSVISANAAVNYEKDRIEKPKGINNLLTGWIQKQQLFASDGNVNEQFGYCVDIDGDYAIVSSFADNSYAASAYIFKYDGSTWSEQQKLTASDAEPSDHFGRVSISGEYALIGAYGDNSNTGSAYIFKRSGSTWTEQQKLTASDAATNDYFGISTDIDGEYAVVGAYYKNNQQGATYVFKRDGSTWSQQQKLTATGGNFGDRFGICVSIDGDYVIVGAEGDGNEKGAAYVFIRLGTVWSQQTKLTASDGADNDRFGINVCIDKDYGLIGAFGDDSQKGSAYVFKRSGTVWGQQAKLTASDGATGDRFGVSVSIDGEYAVIGAYYDDGNTGSVYVFKRSGASWAQEQKLTASGGTLDDWFGIVISIDVYNILIGAYGDDNANGNNAGCAYIFGMDNNAPNPPVITGPTSGSAGTSYPYTFTSTEPDGDDVSYYIKWGDGATSGWTTFQGSGTTYTESHTWTLQNTYTIEAKAKDTYGFESNWATYSVTMPRSRIINTPLLRILQYSHMFPFLQILIQRFGMQ